GRVVAPRRVAGRVLLDDLLRAEATLGPDAAVRADRERVVELAVRRPRRVGVLVAVHPDVDALAGHQDDHAAGAAAAAGALGVGSRLLAAAAVAAVGRDAAARADRDLAEALDDQHAGAAAAATTLVVVDEADRVGVAARGLVAAAATAGSRDRSEQLALDTDPFEDVDARAPEVVVDAGIGERQRARGTARQPTALAALAAEAADLVPALSGRRVVGVALHSERAAAAGRAARAAARAGQPPTLTAGTGFLAGAEARFTGRAAVRGVRATAPAVAAARDADAARSREVRGVERVDARAVAAVDVQDAVDDEVAGHEPGHRVGADTGDLDALGDLDAREAEDATLHVDRRAVLRNDLREVGVQDDLPRRRPVGQARLTTFEL